MGNSIIETIFTILFVCVIPGLMVSFVFFPRKKIDVVQRSTFSFMGSFIIVPLLAFYAQLIGIPITLQSLLLEVLLFNEIIALILVIVYRVVLINKSKSIYYYHKDTYNLRSALPLQPLRHISAMSLVVRDLFQISVVTYLMLFLAEAIKSGFVSYFFNLNILLAIVIISGVGMVISHTQEKKSAPLLEPKSSWPAVRMYVRALKDPSKNKLNKKEVCYISTASLIGGLVVYYKTSELGVLSIFIACITSIITYVLTYILYTTKK